MGKKNCLNKIAYVGLSKQVHSKESPECIRKIFTIKIFGVIGLFFTLPFGFLSLYNGNHILAFSLIIIAMLLALNYLLMAKTENYSLGASLIVYPFLVLFLYLVYSGGVSQTGALWIYAFPALALFLHGLKHGLTDIAVFIVLLTVIFLFVDEHLLEAHYSGEYKFRLLISFLVVTFLSALYEYSNNKSMLEMHILTKKLINAAKQDQLTELKNRRGIYEEMECLYNEAKENNTPLCLMLCDIDYFEDINDRYGHKVGEMVIKEVAREIQNSIRNSDTVARWSGEEFLILLPHTELKDAHKFTLSLEKRIKNLKIKYNNQPIQVSLSIGVSDTEQVNSIYAAVRYADNEMYKSKKKSTLLKS